jgi:hypothetical protein
VISGFGPSAFADGTRAWEQSKFEDLAKGTATGVAIRSSGGLELAPSFKLLYATPSTYIWAVAADESGNVYAATGSPARVYQIAPDGTATIIFEPQELQVQTLEVGAHGVIYAATAPDGKVYKIEHRVREKADTRKGRKTRRRQKIRPSQPWIHRGLRPSILRPAQNISGTSFSIRPGIFTSPPAITVRSIRLRRRANTRFSSRAMTRTSACSRSTRRAT